MEITAIKKEEVKKIKKIDLDPVMVKAANNLVVKNYNGDIARFNQQELIDEYHSIGGALSKDELLEKKQLDIESAFIDNGWEVDFFNSRHFLLVGYKDYSGKDIGYWEFR
jgi:hypothetical protein